MKALLYPAWDRIELTDQPKPSPGRGEVLLRVAACGLCGSELEAIKNHSPRRTPPLVLGHEFCGEVAALGDGVDGSQWRVGRKVVSNSLVACNQCVRCRRGDTHLCGKRQIFGMNRPGAFAEFVNVPADCLIPWPDNLPAEAACLAEPLANGVHVAELARPLKPKTVLVIGAGPIGLMCQGAIQSMLGAEVVVTDLNEDRLNVARAHGAKETIPGRSRDVVKTVQELTGGEGADVVVDAVGGAVTKQQSIAAARPGGAAVWIGLHENPMTLNSFDVTLPEKQVLGSYAATMGQMRQALELMSSGKVKTEWAERFPIGRGVEAFDRMLNPKGRDIKAVIVPS
jgi:threonine dehydrogenase-like Zn-dependent dehydrogenase